MINHKSTSPNSGVNTLEIGDDGGGSDHRRTVVLFFAFLSLLFFVIALGINLVQSEAKASPGATRQLNFPSQVSLGRLALLDQNFSLTDKHICGKSIGLARGRVMVPADKPIMLIAADTLTDHADCLDRLPADALTAILLNRTEFGDEQFAHIKHLTGLRYLDLRGTNLSDKGLAPLGELVNLGYLDMSHTALHGLTFSQLHKVKKLQFLNLGFNALDRRAFPELAKLNEPELKVLIVSGCGFNDSDLHFLTVFSNLRELEITDSRAISDKGLSALNALRHLTALDLRGTRATLKGVLALHNLALKFVTLPENQAHLVDKETSKLLNPGMRLGFEHPQRSVPSDFFAPLH